MDNEAIAVRAYTVPEESNKRQGHRDVVKTPKRVLVFDTETRTDIYQNLVFGYFEVHETDYMQSGLFYDPKTITSKEIKVLQTFSEKNRIDLYTLEEFRELFLDEVYDMETMCIGFNLPFDLSRIALKAPQGRLSYSEGFSMEMSEDPYYPRLIVNSQTNTMSFMNWAKPLDGTQKKFRGFFLDLRMTCHALTDRKYSLESACKAFGTKYQKQKEKEHGRIYGPQYIEYCIADVKATYSLYEETSKEFSTYGLKIPITWAYTPASIGKEFLKKMQVRSFSKKNRKFSKETIGHIMNAYFGGRTECKIRKTPVNVDLIDFLSMYPTVCTLQELWKFVIAEKIEETDATEEIRNFVDNFELKDIQDKSKWKELCGIVQIEPNDDVFPLRAKYGAKKVWNIGIEHVTSKAPLWYSIADVVTSKLYTGRTPKILKGIKFIPKKPEIGLRNIQIQGAKINPYEGDLFKNLIEYRQELKDKMSEFDKEDSNFDLFKRKQNVIKIITNAISYGIFVQIDVNNVHDSIPVDVFGFSQFKNKKTKIEKPGFMFNPIIAVAITGAARLLLAATEVFLSKLDAVHAYCDTDSMVIPSKYREDVQAFFQKLNPYDFKSPDPVDVFKLEKANMLFYGISAKRYCLYTIDKKNNIVIDDEKYSSHGLGYLLDPFDASKENQNKDWSPKIWKDILDWHYEKVTRQELREKYETKYAMSQITVSKPRIRNWLKKLDKSNDYYEQIKPFNFCLAGYSAVRDERQKEPVKPIAPFRRPAIDAAYDDFVDLNSKDKKTLRGIHYWKTLWQTIRDYVNNQEAKFEGDFGVLKRRHVNVSAIKHIGKESDDIDLVPILGVNSDSYVTYEDKEEIDEDFVKNSKEILDLEPIEARSQEFSRASLKYIKEKVMKKEFDRIKTETKYRLLVALNEKQNKQKEVIAPVVKS